MKTIERAKNFIEDVQLAYDRVQLERQDAKRWWDGFHWNVNRHLQPGSGTHKEVFKMDREIVVDYMKAQARFGNTQIAIGEAVILGSFAVSNKPLRYAARAYGAFEIFAGTKHHLDAARKLPLVGRLTTRSITG